MKARLPSIVVIFILLVAILLVHLNLQTIRCYLYPEYAQRRKKSCVIAMQYTLSEYVQQEKKLPAVDSFEQMLGGNDFNSVLERLNIEFKYSPSGFRDPQGQIWYLVILDRKQGKLLKILIDLGPAIETSFFEESVTEFPGWCEQALNSEQEVKLGSILTMEDLQGTGFQRSPHPQKEQKRIFRP